MARTPFYSIELFLEPCRQTLRVELELTLPIEETTDILEFVLHRDLELDAVESSSPLQSITFDRDSCPLWVTPQGGLLQLILEEPVESGSTLELFFSYSGTDLGITTDWGVNRLTADWVELGLYTPWYPLLGFEVPVEYRVQVTLAADYQVTGLGGVKQQDGVWCLQSDTPKRDIVVLAAPTLYSIERPPGPSGISLEARFTNSEDWELSEFYLDHGGWLLEHYTNWLGPAASAEYMSVVVAPQRPGGAYARRGLLVMVSSPDFETAAARHFKGLAHETAHLWWQNAPTKTWEDWLNEAFAEYSALLALRARFGEAEFAEIIKAKRESSAELPPVWGLERTHDQAHTVLYDKGCLLLHELAADIGEDNLQVLMSTVYEERVDSTRSFLALLAEEHSRNTAEAFEALLHR